jgi:Tat protein secretion system quality control protein TatD with DNase activity
VRYVAEEIAVVRGIDIDALELATTNNFQRLFNVTIN